MRIDGVNHEIAWAQKHHRVQGRHVHALVAPLGQHWYATDPFLTESIRVQDKYRNEGLYVDGKVLITQVEWISFSGDTLKIATCTDSGRVAARYSETGEVARYGGLSRTHLELAGTGHTDYVLTELSRVDSRHRTHPSPATPPRPTDQVSPTHAAVPDFDGSPDGLSASIFGFVVCNEVFLRRFQR